MLAITTGNCESGVLEITQVSVFIQVSGYACQVEWMLTIENPSNEEVAEASVTVPIPEHGTVTGYATDIANDGVLVDAVIVSKEQARKTFEAETRNKKADSHNTSIVQQHQNSFSTKCVFLFLSISHTLVNFLKPRSRRKLRLTVLQSINARCLREQIISCDVDIPLAGEKHLPEFLCKVDFLGGMCRMFPQLIFRCN